MSKKASSKVISHYYMFKFYIFTKLWRIEVPTRGPDSRFVLEAIIKALISKSSLCSICYQKFEKSKFPIFLIRRTWKGKIIYLLIKRKRVRFDPQISFCKNFNFMGVDVNGRTSEFVDASYRHPIIVIDNLSRIGPIISKLLFTSHNNINRF